MINFIKIIFLLCILPSSVLAHTSSKPSDYLPKKTKVILTVAIDDSGYFPFNYQENGQMKGFSIDILDYFKAHSKYDFEFIVRPWPRTLYGVAQGKIDLILTLFKTPKREQEYHFIDPYYGYEANQLFTLVGNKFEFNGELKQLQPYSIGTTRDYSYGEAFDQADYLNKLPALKEEVLLKLLLGNRVDLIIGNPLIFNRIISKKSLTSQIKVLEPYIATTPVHMALTKKREDSQEIQQIFEQLTQQLKASPYYQQLLDKYQLNFT
ncbi:MAG: transporter substrate-binding domain-containing protein [Litorilituus sp.]|jgi:polar amino acid transport system substrate-binding protein|nr:transporter substrate-binding domain-containing protein [Litorilituus sp.]